MSGLNHLGNEQIMELKKERYIRGLSNQVEKFCKKMKIRKGE